MTQYIIIWRGRDSKEWHVQPEIWPDRVLAEAQLAISAYKTETIIYQIMGIEVPVIELEEAIA